MRRKIIHIDMDAFYASVEQRDRPELRGKPVIVGGMPHERGVVSTCSYEARKFGIHSAMPSSTAHRLCPGAVFLRGNFAEYKRVSRQIREIFHDYTELVEPMSLDEAYLDVTENKKGIPSAVMIAKEIKKRIFETTLLTASAGVSYNKFLAKVASDYRKPDGLTVVVPERALEFIGSLPVGKFYGIGRVTEKKLMEMGVSTGEDLRSLTKDDLVSLFGKTGIYYFEIARGIDDREVMPYRIRKSIGNETTLPEDIDDRENMLEVLSGLAENVSVYMDKRGMKGRTITLKVKYGDFSSITRSVTIGSYISNNNIIMENIGRLLSSVDFTGKKVRLLGVTLSNLDTAYCSPEDDEEQLVLPL
ncbi:MAG: DNA polymerase IV [Spirochaetes bacterium]|jgi:DNA polymerase-4|nr:DNA polymerase IV [Spirochaetota bacterium]